MKVSLNWMREFTSINLPIDELVEKIGAQLGAVEEVIDVGAKYKDIVVAKVVGCVKHPNADKLHVCLIDDGKVTKGVKRDKDGLVEVVCGAPNVKEGLLVAWIPPGATVPSTVDKDPFVIEARELRGVISNGMLASAKELAIGDSHEGLMVLGEHQVNSQQSTVNNPDQIKPGTPLADVLYLNDYIIDIENKMFTHRPDCFGQLGVAREIAGIMGQSFKSPDWYRQDIKLDNDGRKNVLDLKVQNEVPKLVPRFTAVAIKDVKIGPSPAWMQSFLSRVGVKPINNIVDVTNLVMLETGQPLHAYDADKLRQVHSPQSTVHKLGIRLSKKGEELKLLGGKTLKLKTGSVVITDGNKPIGLGGIMGGAGTEVDAKTTNIILECANFNMNTIRRSAMEYGLFTDAATRFTKGQSPLQNMAALVRATNLITQMFGGRVASKVVDDNQSKVTRQKSQVTVSAEFINSRLGLALTIDQIKKLLENVEFGVKVAGDQLALTPPFWRMDIEIPEDIVEEVGRLYGYDHLPQVLPNRSIEPAKLNPVLSFKDNVRQILINAGANELLTYSFVHGSLLDKVGQDQKKAYKLRNALSPDLQYYRQSLTPSLLEKVHPNIKAGFDMFALFELGKVHIKGLLDEQKLPKEFDRVSLVVASKNPQVGASYFAAKRLCAYLLDQLGINGVKYEPLDSADKDVATTYYETTRAATIASGNQTIGRVGEYNSTTRSNLKLPVFCAGFELSIEKLLELSLDKEYHPINRFPSISADLCLKTTQDYSYEELTSYIRDCLTDFIGQHGYLTDLEPLDIYQSEKDKAHKQTTWHINISHPERTLTISEVNSLIDTIVDKVKVKFRAERI